MPCERRPVSRRLRERPLSLPLSGVRRTDGPPSTSSPALRSASTRHDGTSASARGRDRRRDNWPISPSSDKVAATARKDEGNSDDPWLVPRRSRRPPRVRDGGHHSDAGDPVAQTGLATVYLAGLGGVVKDDAEAARLTRLAAEQGFPPAQYDLALLYFTGRGVPKDVGESARWLQKAADSGIAPAQNNLGLLYAVGQGVPKDLKKAAALFRKAADRGFAEAQNNLGVLYANGEGVKKDAKEAKKWFDKAAAQGHPGAQRNIEMMQQQPQPQQKNK